MAKELGPGAPALGLDLRHLFDRFESAGVDGATRGEIISSWQRSVLAGLDNTRFEVPYDADIDDKGRLIRAAGPVIDRVAQDLEETRIGLFLTDQRAHIVARRSGDRAIDRLLDRISLAPGFRYDEEHVGTNAIGTAIEVRGPSVVSGYEHFANALAGVACAATTVTDPATGRTIGVVDLTSAAADASPLMLPLVKRAAWEIEQRLFDETSPDERVLQEYFLRARRTAKGGLVLLNGRTMLVNGAAAGIVNTSDRELVWEWAKREIGNGQQGWSEISLSSGRRAMVRCEQVLHGTYLVGALLQVDPSPRPGDAGGAAPAAASGSGWSSLTATERTVAMLVAEALTNREVGLRLFLSPHTIDFHLRQVFRKLGVRSRIELARILLQLQALSPVG